MVSLSLTFPKPTENPRTPQVLASCPKKVRQRGVLCRYALLLLPGAGFGILVVIIVSALVTIVRSAALFVAFFDADQATLFLEPLGEGRASLHAWKVLRVIYLKRLAHGSRHDGGFLASDHPHGVEYDESKLEAERAGCTATEVRETEEAAFFVLLIKANERARYQGAH